MSRADYLDDQAIIEKLREDLEAMSKNKPMVNIPGARAVAGVAQTDRGVPYKSPHPEQARQDAIQSGIHMTGGCLWLRTALVRSNEVA